MPPEDKLPEFPDILAQELAIIRGDKAAAPDAPPLSALCISGGGIRSATFALGALQGLADAGVLTDFDYLSTVSGGGYIGGWLTAWKQRAGGLDKVLPKLSAHAAVPGEDEPDPIGYLREYNNYLSPKLGFFSADAWTLGATVILNMTLNWLVLVPLLLCALMIPRLILSFGILAQLHSDLVPATLALPMRGLCAALFVLAVVNIMRYLPSIGAVDHSESDFLCWCLAPLIGSALAFMTYDSWFDPDMPGPTSPLYWQMFLWIVGSCLAGWAIYLAFCVKGVAARAGLLFGPLSLAILLTGSATTTAAWLLVNGVFLRGHWSGYIAGGLPLLMLSFLTAGGLFVGLTSHRLNDSDREWIARAAAWALLFIACWIALCTLVLLAPGWVFLWSAQLGASIAAAGGLSGWLSAVAGFGSRSLPNNETAAKPASLKTAALDLAAKLAAPIFVVVLLVGLAILTNHLLIALHLVPGDNPEVVVDYTRADFAAFIAFAFFAAAWIAARYININKFSLHGMYRNRLIRAYLGASNDRSKANNFIGFNETDNIMMGALDPALRPFHVVNITLNLVAGKRLAWQQRKAESFTVSPLHSGSTRLGYRPSAQYGGPKGISLGTAITISGAAASPNMGYHSAGVIGFIMTLFNARLGAWLGNPGKAGAKTWRQDGPSSAVSSLVREAFGLTDDTSSYVYLSDGGHFENLGLYEMVMRGCKRIVVLDSGCDVKFMYEDLGNAFRKIRIDLGIPIDFEGQHLRTLENPTKRCALATIRYSALDATQPDGFLIYVKPAILGTEPPDVATYHASHPDFPHQGTGNQWYDESQTESYRMLGLHTVLEMCAGWRGTGGLSGLEDHLRNSYLAEAKAFRAAG
jgi:hypothetical protein